MPRVPSSTAQSGRLKLLQSVEREITKLELALVELRRTEKKLIRQYERGKYVDEIDALKAAQVKHYDEVKT